MGEWKGKIVTCDKCGSEVRRKLIEQMPETWKYRYEVGYLCPDCNAEYESLIRSFMERK